jgi:hypothetical protein
MKRLKGANYSTFILSKNPTTRSKLRHATGHSRRDSKKITLLLVVESPASFIRRIDQTANMIQKHFSLCFGT